MRGKVIVKLYGIFALNAGREKLEVEVESCKTLKELISEILESIGFGKVKLEDNVEPYALILVNGKPSSLDREVCGGEEVSILPPAVGG